MKTSIDKIRVAKRIRKEITKIEELAADIERNGLINPITVMQLEDGAYQLLAGLRRLKAFEKLGRNEITINVFLAEDAEAALRVEISENEQREPFTFSEQVDYGRVLEEIEREKAKERMMAGKKIDDDDPLLPGTEGLKGNVRDIVASKIGMSGATYERAKFIADNAPPEVIEELDQGKRSIRKTYDEFNTRAPVKKLTREESAEKKQQFSEMTPEEQVVELKQQLKEAFKRANSAEYDLRELKKIRKNDLFNKDSIIENLQMRLDAAEARIKELESLQN